MEIKKFEVGKTYEARSACDHDCVWSFTVASRTACTVTLKDDRGEVKRRRICKKLTEVNGVESVLPLGDYSMAPVLDANHEQPESAPTAPMEEAPEIPKVAVMLTKREISMIWFALRCRSISFRDRANQAEDPVMLEGLADHYSELAEYVHQYRDQKGGE